MRHTQQRGILRIVAAVALALVVAGCTTTQSPARQLDDNAIHAAVKAKLTADRVSNLTNVDVNVTNGVVILAGEVPNATVKAEAEREARSVSGVSRVINNSLSKWCGGSPRSPRGSCCRNVQHSIQCTARTCA